MMNVLFFVRHFNERGTEVAIYDYARYNEEILNNKSYIVAFSEAGNRAVGMGNPRDSFKKFTDRFQVFEIDTIREISDLIDRLAIHFFYTLTYGGPDFYEFHDKTIWKNCKTIKHCVFRTDHPEADFYISIGDDINRRYNTHLPVIPHIVSLPDINEHLRQTLNIPENAIVIGRHGSFAEYSIPFFRVHDSIVEAVDRDPDLYFLFLNTQTFCPPHPRIIHLEKTCDLVEKTRFINTCDAMLHARAIGETFGLAIAEFSCRNKPVITCDCGDKEHIRILKDRAIIYKQKEDLDSILQDIRRHIRSRTDWNAYEEDYSPKKVMKRFRDIIFQSDDRDKVVVLLSDHTQMDRAMHTIRDIRDKGQWSGDIVWITLNFQPHHDFVNEWNVTILQKEAIDMQWLLLVREKYPLLHQTDGREVNKLIQFSKFLVFDTFFHKWDSMLYVDAGMHIYNPIQSIWSIPHKHRFIAPDDRFPFDDTSKTFRLFWDRCIPEAYEYMQTYCDKIEPGWLDKGGYFNNCLWLMDTKLITDDTIRNLCSLSKRLPISRINEMGIMNLYFHDVWDVLPESTTEHVYIFDWCERFHPKDQYIFLKYPLRL